MSSREIQFMSQLENLAVVEEHVIRGGFGSLINEILPRTVRKVEIFGISRLNPNIVGSVKFLRQHYGLDAESIAKKFLNIIKS